MNFSFLNAHLPRGVFVSRQKFRAQIQMKGKRISLGMFDTIEEASAAYQNAAKQIHGQFAGGGA